MPALVEAQQDALKMLSGAAGTPKFMAPELIMVTRFPNSAPQAIDVFGLGVVLHDLAHLGIAQLQPRTPGGTPSDSGTTTSSSPAAEPGDATMGGTMSQWGALPVLMQRYSAGFAVQAEPHCPPGHAKLMLRCLSVDPAERPTARKALEELMALPATG